MELEYEDRESPEPFACYEFNTTFLPMLDDRSCEHCRKWLTMECEHIDDFINDEEWEDEY